MAFLPRPVTMMMLVMPAATASSMTYWMMGLSTRGSISLGWALVAGRKRVPRPAAGNTALRSFIATMLAHGNLRPGAAPIQAASGSIRRKTHRVILAGRGHQVLDPKYVAQNREALENALAHRGTTAAAVFAGADPWALDDDRRAALQEVEELRHRQRTAGEEIARRGRAREDASSLKSEMKDVAERIKVLEARLQEVEGALQDALLQVPNVPDASVPVGKDETA